MYKAHCQNCNIYFEKKTTGYKECPKFCCRKCYEENRVKNAKGLVEYKCQTCGKLVKTKRDPKQIKKYTPKFCSYKCTTRNPSLFSWKNATDKEVKERVSFHYEKNVIRKEGCFGWLGSTDKDGYGILPFHNKYKRAHRAAWFLKYGSIPKKMICHTCDNKICTNTLHMFAGDAKSNKEDEVLKKRHAYGSKNGSAKTNEEQVVGIKKMLSQGILQSKICNIMSLSKSIVSRIATGKTWSHVPYPPE